MKIISKQLISRKQPQKQASTPVPKNKGLSKSLSKPIKQADIFNSPNRKMHSKQSELKVIKEVAKKKKDTPHKQQPANKEQTSTKEKKKKNYCLNLKELKPVNMAKEKQIFFQRQFNYDPFFIYPNISDLNDQEYKDTKRFDAADEQYLKLALRVLDKSLELKMWSQLQKSPILTQETVTQRFNQYINSLDFGEYLTYEFVENTIAPTSVVHNNSDGMSRVLISLPIKYRQHTIEGVLNHEIGTHFVRKFNQRSQKWYKDRKKYNLNYAYLKTEEGLASLNQLVSYVMNNKIPPLLYRAALLYYGCYLASKTSFSKVFQMLATYQPDPQNRWRQVVRVKRGIADTSTPFGMYKDQIYFMGAVQILQNRHNLNMINLHTGKITLEDCQRLTEKKLINTEKIRIPSFMKNMKAYMQCLDVIAQVNMVDKL